MRLALAIGIAYFVAAWLGLALLTMLENVAIFWPAAGIATGALIGLGRRAWLPVGVAVMVASLAANLMAHRSVESALAFALCNTGEALLSAGLIARWFGPSFSLTDLRHLSGFLFSAAAGPAVVGFAAAIAVRAFGVSTAPLLDVWQVWFAAHALGIASVAPVLIGLASTSDEDLPQHELIEGVVALTALFAVIGFVFAVPSGHWARLIPEALLLPWVLWAAARCRLVFAATAIAIIALAVVTMVSASIGRLGDPSVTFGGRVVAMQVELLATTLSALAIAAVFSERRRREAALTASEDRLRSILEATNVVAWDVDLVHDTINAIGPSVRFPKARPGLQAITVTTAVESVHPADRDRVEAAFTGALQGRAPYRTEFRIPLPDGSVRWVASEGTVMRDREGRPLRVLGINQDITSRKEGEEHVRLLMREISHRARNLLSVVQVMARRTASEGDPEAFAERFGDRLAGLATSDDLLVKSDWKGVNIADLARAQLAHFGDLIGTRISLVGSTVRLRPAAAQNIGMALRELATNAAKYGALSATEGSVKVEWQVVGQGEHACLKMRWSEQGGPAVVPPQSRGFGHTVMVDMVKHALNAEVRLDYPPSGVIWELVAPVDWTVDTCGPDAVNGALEAAPNRSDAVRS
jgi:two-component sensor histidine kinase/PAS domain-containing protein